MNALLVAALVLCVQLPVTRTGAGWSDGLPAVVVAAALVAWCWPALRRPPLRKVPLRVIPVLLLVAASLGAAFAAGHPGPDDLRSLLDDGDRTSLPRTLRGEIAEVAPREGGGLRLRLTRVSVVGAESRERALEGAVALTIRYTRRDWQTGDCLEVRSSLRAIRNLGNEGEFDWVAWNARRDTHVTAYAWNDDAVVDRGDCTGRLGRLRRRLAERAAAAGPGGAVVAAIVTGDRSRVTAEERRIIRDAGTAHALAISGLHIGLVAAAVFASVFRLLALNKVWLAVYDLRRPAALAAMAAVLGYVALAGLGPSVVRAAIMALAALGWIWWGRGSSVLLALAAAAVATAFWMPGVLDEAGFRLSYAATLALVAWSRRPPQGLFLRVPGGLRWILSLVQISLLCQLVTLPLVAQDFQRIAVWGVLGNVLVAPLVTAATLLGLAGAALETALAGSGDGVFAGAALAVRAWLAVAGRVAALPMAAPEVVAPGWALCLSWEATIALWLLGPAAAKPWRWLAPVFFAVLLAAAFADRTRGDMLRVDFLSVGQGDATLVRLPGGRVMVVDAGVPGSGRLAVGPFLRRAHVATIDVLVASHQDADHAGGLAELARSFKVGELWLPSRRCEGGEVEAAVAAVTAGGGRVRYGSEIPERSGFADDRAWVERVGAARRGCGNDDSLVLRVAFAGRRVLLAGDIEESREAALLASGEDLAADVLKVPHHGSRTSSTRRFLDAVRPSLAVASLGWRNRFGFPAEEVVQRFDEHGTPLRRTDLHGSLAVEVTAGELRAGGRSLGTGE